MTARKPVWAEKALLATNEVCLTWSLVSTSTCCPSLMKSSRLPSPCEQDSPCADRWRGEQDELVHPHGSVQQSRRSKRGGFRCVCVSWRSWDIGNGSLPFAQNHVVAHTLVPRSGQPSFWSALARPSCTTNKRRPPNRHACPHPEPVHGAYATPLNKQSDFRNEEAFFWLGPSGFGLVYSPGAEVSMR